MNLHDVRTPLLFRTQMNPQLNPSLINDFFLPKKKSVMINNQKNKIKTLFEFKI